MADNNTKTNENQTEVNIDGSYHNFNTKVLSPLDNMNQNNNQNAPKDVPVAANQTEAGNGQGIEIKKTKTIKDLGS